MKGAEATDGLRASANKPTFKLPSCGAENLNSCNDRKMEMENGTENFPASSGPVCAVAKLIDPYAAADACNNRKGPFSSATTVLPLIGAERHGNRRDQVLANLMQTNGVNSRCSSSAALAGAAASRRRCSCGEINRLPDGDLALNDRSFRGSHGSCNCNVENCAWEGGLASAPHPKSRPWRSSSDQTNANAALHRAIASMKKISGEPNGVKKALPKPTPSLPFADLQTCEASDMKARSITNPDARTFSMRERGRYGNSKIQQQFCAQTGCAAGAKASPSLEYRHLQHHQTLQHMQCLHCGSFSTTPVSGIGQGGARSHSFSRKVRDFSWQQELLHEQKRPEPQKEASKGERQAVPSPHSGAPQDAAAPLSRCKCTEIPDPCHDCEQFHGSLNMKLKRIHGPNVMSWQERYMLLCQAIAAGAFVDGCPDDTSGPMFPSNRGYSCSVCDCATCEMGCGMAEPPSFWQAPSSYRNTTTGERMMELEAFSGPIGYVSESKTGAELSSIMAKPSSASGRRRWWARLPSFGKSKSNSHTQAAVSGSGSVAACQAITQCSSCGQQVFMKGGEELSRKLCPHCIARARTDKCESGPIPGAPPRSTRLHPPPNFSRNHKHLPRRWRLMKLCRYLMGFPLQR